MNKLLVLAGLAACVGATACDPYYDRDNRYGDRTGTNYTHSSGTNSAYEQPPGTAKRAYRDGDRRAMMEDKARFFFNQADTNDDGFISRGEQRDFSTRMFNEADTNGDNLLTLSELVNYKREEMRDYKANR